MLLFWPKCPSHCEVESARPLLSYRILAMSIPNVRYRRDSACIMYTTATYAVCCNIKWRINGTSESDVFWGVFGLFFSLLSPPKFSQLCLNLQGRIPTIPDLTSFHERSIEVSLVDITQKQTHSEWFKSSSTL